MKIGFIGIDTGKSSGGIFWNYPELSIGVIPRTTGLIETIEMGKRLKIEKFVVTIEAHNPSKHHGMIKCYGAYKQVLGQAQGMGCNVIEVQPKTWQKFMGFEYGEDTKKQSIKTAKELYLRIKFDSIAKMTDTKIHDLTDAACICEYGRRVYLMGDDKR